MVLYPIWNSTAKIYIMALIKLSAVGITAISGTTGGTTFAYNRAGKYVRNWAKPTNPQTDVQTANRALFGFLSQAWGSLSLEEAAAWREAAKAQTRTNALGDSYTMTGFTYFKSVNQNLINSGLADSVAALPPSIVDAPDPMVEGFTVEMDGGILDSAVILTEFPVAVVADQQVMSIQLYLQRSGKNQDYGTVKSLWGAKNYYPITATTVGQTFSLDITESVAALSPVVGDRMFARVQVISVSGQTSVAVTTDTFVREVTP